jgi:tetratricopeptide (TPR) repeat protein
MLSNSTPPRYEEALDSYLAAHRRLEKNSTEQSLSQRHKTTLDLARTYAFLKRPEETALYLVNAERLALRANSNLKEGLIARTYNQSVISLIALGPNRLNDATKEIDKLEKIAEKSEAAYVISQYLHAHEIYIGVVSRPPSNDWQTALNLIDRNLQRYDARTDPMLEKHLAWLHVNRGISLRNVNRIPEAMTELEGAVSRFGGSQTLDTLQAVATALSEQGYIQQSQAPAMARKALEELVRRFDSHPAPALQALVQLARQRLQRINQPVAG